MTSEDGGSGGAAYGAGAGLLTIYLGALLSTFGVGTRGTGRAAARGAAQAAQKAARMAAERQILATKIEEARFVATSRGVKDVGSYLTQESTYVDPRVAKLGQQLIELQGTGKEKKVAKLQAQIAKREAKTAYRQEYRVVSRYGLAGGPPIAGSADDPEGPYQYVLPAYRWSQ